MCEGSGCAEDIAKVLRDPPQRAKGFALITSADADPEFNLACVETLVEALAELLDTDNQWEKTQAWACLQELAGWYPSVVVKKANCIERNAPQLTGSDRDRMGRVVEALVDTPVNAASSFSVDILLTLRDASSASVRAAAVNLLSRECTYESLRQIDEVRDYEVPRVASAATEGIERLRDDAIRRLEAVSDEDSVTGEVHKAERIVSYLSRHCPNLLNEESEQLVPLLGSEVGDTAVTSIASLLSNEEVTTELIRSELVETVLSIDVTSTERKRKRAEQASEALILADALKEEIVDLVEFWGECLKADEAVLREHALVQLDTLASESPEKIRTQMSQISDLVSEGSSERSERAIDVITTYSRAQSDDHVSYVKEALDAYGSGSIVKHLSEMNTGLRYRRTGDVEHDRFSLDETCIRALDKLWSSIVEERNVPVIWPAYCPQVSVLFAIEALLQFLPTGEDVVLFTSGGGSHWGTLTEVRNEYSSYAITALSGSDGGQIPLGQIIPHARIADGEVKTMSGGYADTRLVLTKRVDELREVDDAGCILLNLTSRVKPEYDEVVNELIEESSNTPIIPIYSHYVKHETNERRVPRYGPPAQLAEVDTLPGVDALEAGLDTDGDLVPPEFPGYVAKSFRELADPSDIKVVGIEDDGLLDTIEPGYAASTELRRYEDDRAAGRIFSALMKFERMPLPFGRYDQWARENTEGYFGPRQVSMQVDQLEAHGEDVVGTGTARSMFDTVAALRRALKKFDDQSPMYEELVRQVREHREEGDSLAVFLPKSTWKRGVRDVLMEDGVVTQSDIDSGSVSFVDPDSVRDLDTTDTLLFMGPQRPQFAGFYVHPNVGETVVLTYRGEWENMIERDVRRYVDRLNEALSGMDYSPVKYPEIDLQLRPAVESEAVPDNATPDTNATEPGPREPTTSSGAERTSAPSGRRGSSGPRTDRDQIAELFNQDRSRDYTSESGDRYEDYKHVDYDIKTVDGPNLTNETRVLKRRDAASSDGRYHWITPRNLESGDQIVAIDSEVYQSLWEEWLDDVYSKKLGDAPVIEDIEEWYEAVTSILEEFRNEANREQSSVNVRQHIIAATSHIDREDQTRWNWFSSALEAESAVDLVGTPSLTIGPQSAEDINSVGHTFGQDEITGEDARRIEQSMRRARGVNASQGHEFAEHLKEKMNEMGDNEVKDAAERYEVRSVEKNS
jgi:hypothetical protein